MLGRMSNEKVEELRFLVLKGNTSEADYIINNNGNIDFDKEYLLMLSVVSNKNKSGKMTKLLLSHGANPNVIAEDGYSVLIAAIQANNAGSVRELLKANTDIFIKFNGKTAIEHAKASNNEELIKAMRESLAAQRNSHAAINQRQSLLRQYAKYRLNR